MILFRRFNLISIFALLGASIAGCTSEKEEPELPQPEMVTLRLALDTGAASSRAVAPDYFEQPEGEFENINTLRVILIEKGNNIEENKLVRTTPTGQPLNDNLEFKVTTGNKQVYLIANEATLTVPSDYKDKYPNTTAFLDDVFKIGSTFSSGIFKEWRVALPGSVQNVTQSLFYDNPNANGLPLTEFFQFNVGATLESQQYDETQTVQLFLTRAAAKVSYNVVVDNSYKGSGVNITGIRLNGLNVQQYVFPRDAVYSIKTEDGTVETIEKEPNIYPGLPKPVTAVNRFITSFSTPARYFQGEGASMIMNLSQEDYVEIKAGTNATRGPVYITESLMPNNTARFNVQVKLEGNDNWLDAKPLGVGDGNNILTVNGAQAIARNTHLRITIRFSELGITWQAIEAPYNSVILKPSFGDPYIPTRTGN